MMADGQKLNLVQVERSLQEIVSFIEPYLQIANAHATDFIVNDFWNTLVPLNIQTELLNMTETELKQLASLEVSNPVCDGSGDCDYVANTGEQHIGSDCHFIAKTSEQHNSVSNNCAGSTNEDNSQTIEHPAGSRSERQNLQSKAKEVHTNIDHAYHETATERDGSQNIKCDRGLLVDWKHESLKDFCRAAQNCCIDRQGLAQSYDEIVLHQDRDGMFVDTFMNEKKSHEIERMANVCNRLVQQHESDLVIDFGSGKGYLGSYLNLQYDIQVLGIDAASVNTNSAIKRTNILTKQWDGLTMRKQSEANQARITKKEKQRLKCSKVNNIEDIDTHKSVKSKSNRHVPVTMFIENHTDLDELVYRTFPEIYHKCSDLDKGKFGTDRDSSSIIKEGTENSDFCEENISTTTIQKDSIKLDSQLMEPVFHEKVSLNENHKQKNKTSLSKIKCILTGLHICGNLSSTSIELFVHSPMLKVLCNVGCCYHLLTEEFRDQRNTDMASSSSYGFPLCSFLKQKEFCLGQTARNLASQSICRLEQSELQGKKFFPRALLEVFLKQIEFESAKGGKSLRGLEQKCSSVQEFIKRACQKLDVNMKVDDTMIEDLIEKHRDQERKLTAFFQLRTVLALCIESLIILDRVCYLLEQECVQDVSIVKMFDPVISPRCYSILATKM